MNKLIKVLLTLGVLLVSITSIHAIEGDYDSSVQGSLTVHLDDLGTNRSNVSLNVYQVGTIDGNLSQFILVDALKDTNVNINDLGDSDKHNTAANTLVTYIHEHSVQPMYSGSTNSEGMYSIVNIPHGMYLIEQTSGFDSFGTIQTFLVSVPYVEDDILLYDVVTETKGEKPEVKVTPTPTPTTPTDTSDTSNVPVYMIGLGGAVVALGIILFVRKKQK